MRIGVRRFTRLTNAFSKKVESLAHAVSLPTTPAMEAGKADHVWSVWEIAALLD
jgi:hypothetical protein